MRWPNALVAVTSAIVLISEIVAARVVAPYVGVTLETFSAVIGCVLAAIAVGNHLGGRLADRDDATRGLAAALALAGVLLAVAPTIVHSLGPQLDGRSPWSALMLAAAGFALPCALLSTVSPVIVRSLGADLSRLGRVAGNVSACATIGALAGNFGAGFWLIGRFGSSTILTACGAATVALAMVVALGDRKRARVATIAAVTAAMTLVGTAELADARPPCTRETRYACLVIEPTARGEFHIQSNGYSSSYTDIDDPTNLRLSYARDIAAALVVAAPSARRFAMIGGGGETLSRYIVSTNSAATVTSYEIDADLVDAVRAALGPPPASDRLRTVIGDARLLLADDTNSFDVVIGDAFSGLSVPWHLTTTEFLDTVRGRLEPGGIYVMNVVDGGSYDFVRSEIASLRRRFDDVVVLTAIAAVDRDRRGPNTNFVIVAGDRLPDAAEFELAARDRGSVSVGLGGTDLEAFVGNAFELTDDHAPADQLVSDS